MRMTSAPPLLFVHAMPPLGKIQLNKVQLDVFSNVLSVALSTTVILCLTILWLHPLYLLLSPPGMALSKIS